MADPPPSTMEANEQMTTAGASKIEFAGNIERIEQVEDGSAVIIHTKDGKIHVRTRCYPEQTVASIINHMYTDSLTVEQVGPALETRALEDDADIASVKLECATCGKACKVYAPKSLEDALHQIKNFKSECSACIHERLTCKRKSPFEERSNQDEPQAHGKTKQDCQ